MRIFLINLARRPDRLAAMTARLGRLALTRVAAVDAQAMVPGALDTQFETNGPLGEIPLGDRCCTLSHQLAWRKFLATGDSHAAILEDDVFLSPGADDLLKDASWIPPGTDVVKLEHYGPVGQRILVSDSQSVPGGFQLARLRSRHTGAAAYILSRRAAEILAGVARFSLPVDHLLFNPNNSPLFAQLSPRQLIPAVARQQDFVGQKSDIEAFRVDLRKLSGRYVRRELIRFGDDLKLLPKQFALWLARGARFIPIGLER